MAFSSSLAAASLKPASTAEIKAFFASTDNRAIPAQADKIVAPGTGGRFGYARVDGLLAVIDTANLSVIAHLPIESQPVAIAGHPSGTAVYVATSSDILVVDPRSRNLLTTIPVGGADQLLLNSAGTHLYAGGRLNGSSTGESGFLADIDAQQHRLVSLAALPSNSIHGMAMLPDDSRIYVANRGDDGPVTVYDTWRQGYIAQLSISVRGMIAADPSGRWVYVVSADGVSVIEVATNAVIATIPIDRTSTFLDVRANVIAFDPRGDFAYVAASTVHAGFGSDSAWVQIIDVATHQSVATIALPQVVGAMVVDPATSRIFVAGQLLGVSARPHLIPAGVTVIDIATRSVVTTVPPTSAQSFTIRRDNLVLNQVAGAVYARDANATYSIDTGDLSDRGIVPAGDRLAFLPDTPVVPGSPWHYVLSSSTDGYIAQPWGAFGDLAVAADYDGDGKADLATFHAGEVPIPGDYDGDGLADPAVFDPFTGNFKILESSNGVQRTRRWGGIGDLPMPADYDGDGKTDIALCRPSTSTWWIVSLATGGVLSAAWGAAGDRPEPFDFDGDGKADLGVHRP